MLNSPQDFSSKPFVTFDTVNTGVKEDAIFVEDLGRNSYGVYVAFLPGEQKKAFKVGVESDAIVLSFYMNLSLIEGEQRMGQGDREISLLVPSIINKILCTASVLPRASYFWPMRGAGG